MFSTIQRPSFSSTWLTLSLLPSPISTKGRSAAPRCRASGAPVWVMAISVLLVRDVGAVAGAQRPRALELESSRRIELDGVRPVERAHAGGDQPLSRPALEPVDVAQPENHVGLLALVVGLRHVVGDAVGVDLGDITVVADAGRADE